MPSSPAKINTAPQQPSTVPRDLIKRMVKLSLTKQKKLSESKTSRLLNYTLNKNHCSRIRKKVENWRKALKASAAPRNSEVVKPAKKLQPIPPVMPNPIPVPRVMPNPIPSRSRRPTWLSPLCQISNCPIWFASPSKFPPGYIVLPNPIRWR
ncbi:hypothetical protein GCK72_004183 [Caenorhabditis remanei]|uniref:Uncharacterized protein n=1 Tax=Caenorhabditis remanei TaxID=31234 RepID=A0A6A5HBP0_CAERE|nr:hypothetical protein GCK72_004183 [Caenorhabditis remanei]KAF1764236.1 hypothetical protein GCK72_004183 [Caenorhabditis remanei]